MTDGASRSSASSYDDIPYEAQAIFDTHPEHLAMIAALYGVPAASPESCRVLELGCARGDNLMAMATTLPGASFVGVDGSARQIADGETRRKVAALDNVRLLAADFSSLPDDLGEFDYVVCHGVYSWLPPQVAETLLRLCRRHLSPGGLAYVSYNTLPGWHRNGLVREVLRFHVRSIADPHEQIQQARSFLEFLARFAREEEGTYRAMFRKIATHLEKFEDYYLFHEYLEEHNRPVYFTEFVERAVAVGMQYVGETSFAVWDSNLPKEAADGLASLDNRIVRNQYLDFLANRMFRRSLLARAGGPVPNDQPDASAIRNLFVTSLSEPASPGPDVASDAPEEFATGAGVRITIGNPVMKAALGVLVQRAPASLPFEELYTETLARGKFGAAAPSREDLSEMVLRCFVSELVALSGRAPVFAVRPGDRPAASPLARAQASEGTRATALTHRVIRLEDLTRFVLRRCDGSRDRAALSRDLSAAVTSGDFTLQDEAGSPVTDPRLVDSFARDAVESALVRLAHLGLLMAPGQS